MEFVQKKNVNFPCFLVHPGKGSGIHQLRRVVADHALLWIKYQYSSGRTQGCVIFDIDDTLVNHQEQIRQGFEFMTEMYADVHELYPVHLITARPDYTRAKTKEMLKKRNIHIPPDRLHMMDGDEYDNGDSEVVEKFKWDKMKKCMKEHENTVIARFGDRLWDVAHLHSLNTYMKDIEETDCCIFFDPYLNGTLSAKLPGR